MNKDKLHELYNREHAVCPKCRTRNFWQTLVGFYIDQEHPEEAKNKNEVTCNCGWTGIYHDLVKL